MITHYLDRISICYMASESKSTRTYVGEKEEEEEEE